MKLYVSFQNAGEVVVEHRNKKIPWRSIKSIEQKDFNIFKEINEYWESCTMDKQDQIFEVYQSVSNTFAEFLHLGATLDISDLIPKLRPIIAKLFELHKQEDVYHWYRFNSGIGIPSNIPDVYDESQGRPGTRDQTYDKADYERLIVLSVSIRCMIPIWGEFIIRTENVLGNALKEYWAMMLLRDSNIVTSLAMHRLRRYIDAMVSRTQIDPSVSLKVTSAQNFGEWMLGLTVVRRLTRGDLRTGIANTNIAAFIYGFLRMKLEGMDGAIGEVKEKKPISSSSDTENNLSDLEGFRIKQSVPTGEVEMPPAYLDHSMKLLDMPSMPGHQLGSIPTSFGEHGEVTSAVTLRPLHIALNPVVDIRQLVKQAFSQTRYLNSELIDDTQLLLCGYLTNEEISMMSIPYMNKTSVRQLIAFCAGAMWSYKQYDLVCLILNIYRYPMVQESIIRPADSRMRVTKDNAENLRKFYPHVRPGRGGKPIDSGAVFNAIELIVDMLREKDIYYNLPPSWARELGVVNGAPYQVPSSIRNILADLFIRINTAQENQPLF